MKKMELMFLLVAMTAVLTAVSEGAEITPINAKQSSAYSADRVAANLGNANGMDVTETYLYNLDGSLGGEPTSANGVEWVTRSESLTTAVCAEGRVWAIVDLGAVYDLGEINIWNFQWNINGTTDLSNRGAKTFDVYVRNTEADTDDGTAGGTEINVSHVGPIHMTNAAIFDVGVSNPWLLALADQPIARAPNADDYTGESFDLTGHTGRFVAIVVRSYYRDSDGGAGLGKVRFNEGTGTGSPDPYNGETDVEIDLSSRFVPGSVSWEAPETRIVLGYDLYMDPNSTKVFNATAASPGTKYYSIDQAGTSFDPGEDLDYDATYYWRVDTFMEPDGDPNSPDDRTGPIWSFTAATLDPPPTVVIDTPDTITWTNEPVQLDATITDIGSSAVTIDWTASDPNAVFTPSAAAEDPVVTVDYPAGNVTLTCSVTDAANPETTDTDTMVLQVYADACAAARVGAGRAALYPMDLTPDCMINLSDFAAIAGEWLTDYALTDPIPVP